MRFSAVTIARIRKENQCSMQAALAIASRNYLHQKIDKAKDFTQLKSVLHELVEKSYV